MEQITPFENILRIKQVYTVGGNFEQPSDFTRKINKNIKILNQSDNNAKVIDIKINIFNDRRFGNYGPCYLAFIIAEVDIDTTPKVEKDGITRKKKKKRR